MTIELNDLHRAALILATKLIAALDDEQQQHLDLAVRGGAVLALEISGLPDVQKIQLFYREREGAKVNISSITTTPAVMQ